MKRFLSRFKSKKGFTLIELLVVIGILGILAATLVATIDPFEQLKKANDTKVQNATVEFQTANVRYYTGQNGFPWDADGSCRTDSGATASVNPGDNTYDILTPVSLETAISCITDLANTGELKASFTEVTGTLENIFISEQNNVVVVCYKPTSRAGQNDKGAHYTDDQGTADVLDGEGVGTCKSNQGATDCYWCAK